MPSKRIIILDNFEGTKYHVALWADVPATRQSFYASSGVVSAWTGAAAADNTAIASGAVAERVIQYDAGQAESLATIRVNLQATWTAYQAYVTAWNPWARFGTFWDGTTWTAGGVA